MDTWSSGRLAGTLGVSVPTVHRAARRLGLDVGRTEGGHLRFSPAQARALGRALGVAHAVEGRSREAAFVLAALARSPLGLRSVRAVGRVAGVSPTAAGRVLEHLERTGLVVRQRRRFVEGGVVDGELWRANLASPRWPATAAALAGVVLPAREPAPRRRGVPRRLTHLLWNADLSRLDPERHGPYLAARLLLSDDLQGVAWAAANLPAAALRSAAALRGVPPDRRALAENLAAAWR